MTDILEPDNTNWVSPQDPLGINDIIDIVEKPWLKTYRKDYETYLKLMYNDESE